MWIPVEKAEEMWITYREDHGCVVRVPRALEQARDLYVHPLKKERAP
jgi:hypothetical protein